MKERGRELEKAVRKVRNNLEQLDLVVTRLYDT
jgi:hypothetical protein